MKPTRRCHYLSTSFAAQVALLLMIAAACDSETAANENEVETGNTEESGAPTTSTPDNNSASTSDEGPEASGIAGQGGGGRSSQPTGSGGASVSEPEPPSSEGTTSNGGSNTIPEPEPNPQGGAAAVEPEPDPASSGGMSGSGGSSTTAEPESNPQGGAASTGGTANTGGSTQVGGAGSGGGAQGGVTGDGGTTSEGGAGNSGNVEPTGVVGQLGADCSPPAALACAGNAQKVTLICGGDGTWEAFEVCDTGSVCDSRDGINAGTCQPQASECAGIAGSNGCADFSAIQCDADGISFQSMECDWCWEGSCIDPDEHPCPTPERYEAFYDCPGECNGSPCGDFFNPGPSHLEFDGASLPVVIRLPETTHPDLEQCSEGVSLQIGLSNVQTDVVATVDPPWGLPNVICENVRGTSIRSFTPIDGKVYIIVNTLDEFAPAGNLVIREAPP